MDRNIVLVDKAITDWKIVVGRGASITEKHAGEELQNFLKQISGAELPIVSDQAEMAPHEIIIGKNSHLAKLNTKIMTKDFGDEEFTIRTMDGFLIIAGGTLRGTLYGVYTFLEDYLGCRWFSSKVSRIPKLEKVAIPEINITQNPILEYREPHSFDAYDADWAVRNKTNGSHQRLKAVHGGKIYYSALFVHSFDFFVPVKEFFDTHPEYFSEVDGKRISHRTQLCLTNPEVLEIMIQRVRAWIEKNPGIRVVTVTQNDWYNPCQCEKCKAIDDAEGSHMGTMLHFVNKVAEAIEEDYPDVSIDTLAYQYTRKAPKTVRPRKNVIIRLCSIECCFSHPHETCLEINPMYKGRVNPGETFANDLIEWGKICNRLYIWDYVTNFSNYVMPFPNLRVLQPNMQFFVRNNVKGVFEQGSYAYGGGEEFAELRTYMIAKLLWDPFCDINLVMNEFLTGYYGQAAAPIREYIDILHDKVEKENIHIGLYDAPNAEYLTKDILKKADELFDRAEMLADSKEVLERVRIARFPIRFVNLTRTPMNDENRQDEIEDFFADLRNAGISEIWERRPLAVSKKMLEAGIYYEM